MDDCIESDIVFKWTNCCRLCLSNNVEYDLFDPLHDVKCKTLTLHLDLLVYRGDPMPRKLCTDCWAKVESWQDFRLKCSEIEVSLKKRLLPYKGLEFVKEYIDKVDAVKEAAKNNKSPEDGTACEKKSANEPADSTNAHFFGVPIKIEPIEPVTTNEPLVTFPTSEPLVSVPTSEPLVSVPTIEPLVSVKKEVLDPEEERSAATVAPSPPSPNLLPTPQIKVRTNLGYDDAPVPAESHESQIEPSSEMAVVTVPIKSEISTMSETTQIMNMANSMEESAFKGEMSHQYSEFNNDDESVDRTYNLRSRPESVFSYSDGIMGLYQEFPQPVQQQVTPWKCPPCSLYFRTKDDVTKHQASDECKGQNKEKHTCPVCEKVFFDECELAVHNLNHLRIVYNATHADLRACLKCDQYFIDRYRYNTHIKKFHGKVTTESTSVQPEFHPQNHDPEQYQGQAQVYACSLCIERFKSENLLYDHRFAMHGIPDERVSCTLCLEKFRTAAALKDHAWAHQIRAVARKSTSSIPETNYKKCRRCGITFASLQDLKRHTDLKHKSLHNCIKCKRRFATRSLMLIHLRTHNRAPPKAPIYITNPADEIKPDPEKAEKMMVCTTCDVVFECAQDVSMHVDTHYYTNNNPGRIRHLFGRMYNYQCPKCPQMFLEQSSAHRHSQFRHFGQRVHFLPLEFPAKRASIDVWDNRPLVNQAETYTCKKCSESFASIAVLNFHLKKKHTEQDEVEKCMDDSRMVLSLKRKADDSSNSNSFNGRKGYKCRYCVKTCSSTTNLKKHEKTHDPITGGYKCTCGKIFQSQTLLYEHRKICYREKAQRRKMKSRRLNEPKTTPSTSISTPTPATNETCNVCFQSYETRQLLQLHVSTAHGMGVPSENPARELWREECNKIIRKVNGVLRCTLCRVRFENNEEVSWHQGQHARGNAYIVQLDECLFQCTVCGKLFKQREDSLNHISSHAEPDALNSSESPSFNCPFCSQAFSTEISIRNHIHSMHPSDSAKSYV